MPPVPTGWHVPEREDVGPHKCRRDVMLSQSPPPTAGFRLNGARWVHSHGVVGSRFLVQREALSFPRTQDAHVPLYQTEFRAGEEAGLTRPSQIIYHANAFGR